MLLNDSLSSFENNASQQSHNAYQVFYDFLNEVKPKRILEIGTALGGFTKFLKIVSNECNLDINVRSYDIITLNWYDEIRDFGVDLRVENIFNSDYSKVNDDVIQYINEDGLTIILCDGGWKIGEFNLLSNYMKVGDIIMAHDYAKNENFFNTVMKDKLWNWFEISENHIIDSCLKNNLIDYNEDVFSKVAWACKIKES